MSSPPALDLLGRLAPDEVAALLDLLDGFTPEEAARLRVVLHRPAPPDEPLCPACAVRVVPPGADWCGPCTARKARTVTGPSQLGTPPPVCEVPSCDNVPNGRRYCSAHLRRLSRYGDVLADVPLRAYGSDRAPAVPPPPARPPCVVHPSCDGQARSCRQVASLPSAVFHLGRLGNRRPRRAARRSPRRSASPSRPA